MDDREENVFRAKIYEQAELYEDMKERVMKIVNEDEDLSIEERNLISVCFKNLIGRKRTGWRVLQSLYKKETKEDKVKIIKEIREKVSRQVRDIVKQVMSVVDDHVLPNTKSNEAKVFFNKMKGDYHRYTAEISEDDERKDAAENALVAYKAANDLAQEELKATNPVRLGLALNFSVFYYEILNAPDKACRLAKTAFDDAVGGLESLPEKQYKEASLIMQLLRDNLTLWTADLQAKALAKMDEDKD